MAGTVPYGEAQYLQRRLHARVADGAVPPQLLLLEHPHVYTLGRRASPADVLASDEFLALHSVEVHQVDRGGEVTYHGPGQLVGYPIVRLRGTVGGPLRYVRALERAVVTTLAEFGVSAHSGDRPTGVWVGDAKVAAIGVRVSRGVTTHGVALNVDPDLSMFEHIVACGMPDLKVTSMAEHLDGNADVASVAPVFARYLGAELGLRVRWSTPRELRAPEPARSS